MKPEQAIQAIERKLKAIQRGIATDLPRVVGKHAVDFYRDSFIRQGFTDQSVEPWTPAKRLARGGKRAGSNYKTLLSGRKELYNSIHFIPGVGRVKIRSDKPYSKIHNEGGNITVPVTAKMKKFAWAKHYQQVGKGSKEYTPWKGLALTNKKQLTITIPKRQFMGQSQALNAIIGREVKNYVQKIFNS